MMGPAPGCDPAHSDAGQIPVVRGDPSQRECNPVSTTRGMFFDRVNAARHPRIERDPGYRARHTAV